MREPDIDVDGWSLEDGEAYHSAAPQTFWIPDRADRERLEPGDLAKLIFRISVDNAEEPIAVERMWVVVRERTAHCYLGILDNEPDSIAENDEFWLGTELPFAPEHVIDIDARSAASVAIALEIPRRRWETE